MFILFSPLRKALRELDTLGALFFSPDRGITTVIVVMDWLKHKNHFKKCEILLDKGKRVWYNGGTKIKEEHKMKTNKELMDELIHKAEQEQEEYREKLLSRSKEDVLESAYAYAVREDILLKLYYIKLTNKEVVNLLKSENLVGDIFSLWEDSDQGYMKTLGKMIKSKAKS